MKAFEAIVCTINDGVLGTHHALTIIAKNHDDAMELYNGWLQQNPSFDEVDIPREYGSPAIIGPRELLGPVDLVDEWLADDQHQAMMEGWFMVFDEPTQKHRVVAYQQANIFESDAHAWEWVFMQADEYESELHMKAIRLDNAHLPEPSNWKYNAGYQSAAGYHD